MKKITILFLSLSLYVVAISQTIIKNPNTGYSNLNIVKITQVELNDTATILSFSTHANPGYVIGIPKATYIQPLEKEKLYVKSTQGIPFNEPFAIPASGEASYKVIFPKIDNSVKTIDFCMSMGDDRFIYDIQLKTEDNKTNLPKELVDNWFNAKTGDWELSFTDKAVIYKSKVWSYDKIDIKKGKGTVSIRNEQQTIDLFVKTNRNGSCLIGLTPKSLTLYQKDYSKLTKNLSDTDKPFELPLFKNDSATYCGYIKDYNTRLKITTFSIFVDDILTGEQNSYVAKIAPNGYFSVKLPFCYPHFAFINSSIFNFNVYLEPGKEVFQLIDSTIQPLFMGNLAKLNTDIFELAGLNSFNYDEAQTRILTMNSDDYKTYCQNSLKRDLYKLDSIYKTNSIGIRAYQLEKMELEYSTMSEIMNYSTTYNNAYKKKNNIPEQQESKIKIDSLSPGYFNFITNQNANNPLAVLSSGYDSFINKLKYLDIICPRIITVSFDEDFDDKVSELKRRGYLFTESEKNLVSQFDELKLLNKSVEQKTFQDKYLRRLAEFNTKYMDKLQVLIKETKLPVNYSMIENYLISKGVTFSESDKEIIKVMKVYEKSEVSIKLQKLNTAVNHDSFNLFSSKHQDVSSDISNQKMIDAQLSNLKNKLGIETGITTDIIVSQNVCQGIVVKMTPISEYRLKLAKDQITTPFIAEYLTISNQQTKDKIEANKKLVGSNENEVPQTVADSVLSSILKKYKGKVVYVDFWATWCGPCLGAIKNIKPFKDEMANENVVFVYITNQTSPKETWSNMIPGIKGEHYRLSENEWNFLAAKYNISGIPRVMLVDKHGVIRNQELRIENETLKIELEKLWNE